MQYVLGIDNGGTNLKAVLFTTQGSAVATVKYSLPVITPAHDREERDMEMLWHMNCKAIREVIDKANIAPGDILSVAFCGHGKGLYLWGKNQRPVRMGILSTDSRASAIVDGWNANHVTEELYPLICQTILPCQPVALLKWLLKNETEAIENTQWIFSVKDYLRYRMTGSAYAEISDVSGSGFLNLQTKLYDERILDALGLRCVANKLPPVRYSADLCGTVTNECASQTGLLPGTPVAGGLFDIDACAIGMNIINEKDIAVIAGTWSINEYISRKPSLDGLVKMNSLYCIPGYYLLEESSPTSASNQEWFVNAFLREYAKSKNENIYQSADTLVAAVPPDSHTPIFLPYLYGGTDNARARATFAGLSANHERPHIVKAIYEGVVYGHRKHIDRLLKSRMHKPNVVRLSGGVVNSPLWVQLFADILQMPVQTIHTQELGALGAAMTAAIAVGVYPDYQTAAAEMVKDGLVYLPQKQLADHYHDQYNRFLKVDSAMDTVW